MAETRISNERHPREGGDPSPAVSAGASSGSLRADVEDGSWMPAGVYPVLRHGAGMTPGLCKHVIVAAMQRFFAFISRDITDSLPEGNVLVIAPHPDDETFGCGAAIARLAATGRRVRIVAATDGSASTRSHVMTPDALAALRREEMKKAVAALGADPDGIVFLNHPDGRAASHVEPMARDLAAQIKAFAPSAVFMPYGLERSEDHRAVTAACDMALVDTAYAGRVLEYPVWFWPKGAIRHMLKLRPLLTHRRVSTAGFLEAKKAAIAAHRSQVENLTGEACWTFLPAHFVNRFTGAYELFFERRGG